MLRIGKLAEHTGVSVETLRYYERCNLLNEPQRSASGYRLYPSNAVNRIQFILNAKNLGFSLKDIVELLSLQVTRQQHTCGEVKAIAQSKLSEIEQKINNLQHIQQALLNVVASCAGGNRSAKDCSILEALENHG